MLTGNKLNTLTELLSKQGHNPVNSSIYKKYAEYVSWYRGQVNEVHRYTIKTINGVNHDVERTSLQMAKKVAEDWSGLLVNEKLVISVDDKDAQIRLDAVLEDNSFLINFGDIVEKGFAIGTACMVEYVVDTNVKIDYITGDLVLPISYDNNVVTGIVTVNESSIYIGNKQKFITHVTKHTMNIAGYMIEHEVFSSDSGSDLGDRASIHLVFSKEEAEELAHPVLNEDGDVTGIRYFRIVEVDRPFFQIIRPNISNNFDIHSPMGISVYANAIEILKSIDIKYDASRTEVELGKKRIFVDSGVTTEQEEVDNKGRTRLVKYFDTQDKVFQSVPLGDEGENKMGITDYTPELNTAAIDATIANELNWLSFKCGLGTDYYSFEGGSAYVNEKQVISSNSDTWRWKKKHELILGKALRDMAYIILYIEGENNRLDVDVDDLKITVRFDDSIIEDDTAIVKSMREDAVAGNIPMWRYIARRYQISKTDAIEWVAEAKKDRADVFGSLIGSD